MADQEIELSELDNRDVDRLNVIEETDLNLPEVPVDLQDATDLN
jgi:hypothetical protein